MSGDLEKALINIRKTNFRDIIEFRTFQKESGVIFGLSFYSIIIKQLLKIYEKEKIFIREHLSFFRDSYKIAFKLWLEKKPNKTTLIKHLIEDFLSNNNFHELEEYEKIIYK